MVDLSESFYKEIKNLSIGKVVLGRQVSKRVKFTAQIGYLNDIQDDKDYE